MLSERSINTAVLPVWLCKEEAASPAGEGGSERPHGCRQLCVLGSREGGPWARAPLFLKWDRVLSSCLGGRASIRQGQALLLCIRLDRSLVSLARSTWGNPGGISGAKAG